MFSKVDKAIISAAFTLFSLLGSSAGWFDMDAETQAHGVELVDWIIGALGGAAAGVTAYQVPNK